MSDQPEVCEWVRSDSDFGFDGSNRFTSFDQSRRAARILATSMKKFMPIAQKKLSRGAKASTASPVSTPACRYSTPSASVYASSRSFVAPASWMWYPEIEIELKRGIFALVNAKMSEMIRIEGCGG